MCVYTYTSMSSVCRVEAREMHCLATPIQTRKIRSSDIRFFRRRYSEWDSGEMYAGGCWDQRPRLCRHHQRLASFFVQEINYSLNINWSGTVINPRRACAARVIVVVLCVCLSVCLSTTMLALQTTRRLMNDTNSFSTTRARKKMWRFC